MPIHWTIDSSRRLITATVEGAVTRADAEGYLDAMERAGAVSWRKLIDAQACAVAMDHDDVMAVCVRIRNFHGGQVGALAVVPPPGQSEAVGRILGILAAADRPIRVFAAAAPARRWLDSLVAEDKAS